MGNPAGERKKKRLKRRKKHEARLMAKVIAQQGTPAKAGK